MTIIEELINKSLYYMKTYIFKKNERQQYIIKREVTIIYYRTWKTQQIKHVRTKK